MSELSEIHEISDTIQLKLEQLGYKISPTVLFTIAKDILKYADVSDGIIKG